MFYEIVIGIALAVGFFVIQIKMSRRVNDMTEEIHKFTIEKAELEQKYKTSQCQRIIEILKDIEGREKYVKESLERYQIGNSTNESSNVFMEATVHPFKYNIQQMSNAMGQLQGRLNDLTFGEEFTEDLGLFNMLPKRILIDKIPQQAIQEHQVKGLIRDIDEQLEKTQAYISKFKKEMESSLAEKREEDQSVAREILNHRKYFNAPKL